MQLIRKRRLKTYLAAALAVAATTSALAACSSSAAGDSSSSKGSANSIVTPWPSDVDSLDPAQQVTDQDKELAMNDYQTLVNYHFAKNAKGVNVWDGTVSDPGLATSWAFTGSSITFHLRPGIKFYPSGNPMTAADVKFSLDRSLGGPGYTEANNSGIFKASQIVVVDAGTIRIDYANSAGQPVTAGAINLATLRMPFFGIEDMKTMLSHATASDKDGSKWIKTHVAGTGPYYLASREPGQQLVLQAVPKLWSGEPAFQKVTIRVINDGNVPSLLKGGSVNMALYGLSPKDYQNLAGSFTVTHADTPDYMYLQLAEDKGPLSNEKVRQAIANAAPYDQIIKQVYYGKASRAYSYVNPQAAGYKKSWAQYGSMAKAKALMKAAGSPKISIPLHYSNQDSTFQTMALLLKNALGQIGITLTLMPETSAAMFTTLESRAAGKTDGSNDGLALFNLSVYLDDPKGPVNFWTETKGGLNFQRFSNPTVDRLLNQNALAPAGAARNAAFEKIQDIVAADASFIPLVLTGRTIVTAKGIANATFQPEIGVRYWEFTKA